jgi:hypothetical protein
MVFYRCRDAVIPSEVEESAKMVSYHRRGRALKLAVLTFGSFGHAQDRFVLRFVLDAL